MKKVNYVSLEQSFENNGLVPRTDLEKPSFATNLPEFIQGVNDSISALKQEYVINESKTEAKELFEKYQANITSAMVMINSAPQKINYILDVLIPRGELCLIYGDSACGKSMLARCILFAIAYGMDEYMGYKIDLKPEERKVALCITEDSLMSIHSLIQRQAQFFEQYRTIENPVFDIISDFEEGMINTLDKLMKEQKYSLIVVDTPQDDILGSMNDNNIVRNYFNDLTTLSSKYYCSFLALHHKRKYTLDKAPSKEDLSGTRAFIDKPRSIFEFRKHVDYDDIRLLTPVKGSYQSDEILKNSMHLKFHKDTLVFEATGDTTPSDQIHLSFHREDDNELIRQRVIELRASNPKIRQSEIAELLREDFPQRKINQSQVSNILKSLNNKNSIN